MPGFLLYAQATVQCAHAGQAQPTLPNPRVKVSGGPIVTQSGPYMVSGCTQQPATGPPCVTAQWVSAALRIKADGQPVLLQDSQAVCTPTGTPLIVNATQTRVKGM
jgi:hypothetical protein